MLLHVSERGDVAAEEAALAFLDDASPMIRRKAAVAVGKVCLGLLSGKVCCCCVTGKVCLCLLVGQVCLCLCLWRIARHTA